ncbi:hypothetical protein GCM10010442_28250 [Kitasatospora kifunensis]
MRLVAQGMGQHTGARRFPSRRSLSGGRAAQHQRDEAEALPVDPQPLAARGVRVFEHLGLVRVLGVVAVAGRYLGTVLVELER